MRKVLIAAVAGALLLGLVFWGGSAMAAVKAGLLMGELFPGSPWRPLSALTPLPILEEVTYPFRGREMVADVYRPASNGRHGSVVVTFGANQVGRRDPRLVTLASGLARLGYVVLIPESDNLRANWVPPEEVDRLVASYLFLEQQPYTDPKRIGMAGFCLGGSLTALAAADLRISDQVAFVNLFGAYFDIVGLIQAAFTETISTDGQIVSWKPEEQTREILTDNLIATLPSEAEQADLRRALGGDDEARRALTPVGAAVYELLSNRDPTRVRELANRLDPAIRDRLQALSPSAVVGELQAPVFIMHDADDAIIPSVESVRFAEVLSERGRVHLSILRSFKHMNPTMTFQDLLRAPSQYAGAFFTFYQHLYLVLREM